MIFPLLMTGFLNACSLQPSLQPKYDPTLQLAYSNKAVDTETKPALQADIPQPLLPKSGNKSACNKPY